MKVELKCMTIIILGHIQVVFIEKWSYYRVVSSDKFHCSRLDLRKPNLLNMKFLINDSRSTACNSTIYVSVFIIFIMSLDISYLSKARVTSL